MYIANTDNITQHLYTANADDITYPVPKTLSLRMHTHFKYMLKSVSRLLDDTTVASINFYC